MPHKAAGTIGGPLVLDGVREAHGGIGFQLVEEPLKARVVVANGCLMET